MTDDVSTVTDAADLRERVEEGWTFYDAWNLNDTTVTDADASLDPVRDDRRFEVSDEAWAFEAEDDDQRFYYYVEPSHVDGRGYVRAFWYDEEGNLAGHHEEFAKAFYEVNGGDDA